MGLKKRMNELGKSQLTAIFNTDPKGREVLSNLRTLAEVGSRIQPVYGGNWRRVTELLSLSTGVASAVVGGAGRGIETAGITFGALEGGGYALNTILYSKRLTSLLTRGIELSAMGSARGAAMVERAIALAMEVDLSKPVKINTPPPPPKEGEVPAPPNF